MTARLAHPRCGGSKRRIQRSVFPLVEKAADHRRDLRLSVDAISAETGINLTTIIRWETGASDPKLSNFVAYLKSIGMEFDIKPAARAIGRGSR